MQLKGKASEVWIKLYIFLKFLWQDKQVDTIFKEIGACFNFWHHVELSRSMAVILEMS